MRLPRRTMVLAALGGAVLLSGCATMSVEPSGFLSDYGELRAVDGSARLRVQPADARTLTTYRAILIDPPLVKISGTATADADALKAVLAEALGEELAKGRPLVTEAGPGVLRVRTAITGVRRANVPLNVVSSLLLVVPVTAGGAAAEAELVDSVTGKRVAAMVWQDQGTALSRIASLKAYSRYGQARQQLASFARDVNQLATRGDVSR